MKPEYKLTPTEIEAIIVALPLVAECSDLCDTELQANININCSISAAQKLSNREPLIPNEMRVIALACNIAVMVLSGRLSIDIEAEYKKDLGKNFFIYNHLVAAFKP